MAEDSGNSGVSALVGVLIGAVIVGAVVFFAFGGSDMFNDSSDVEFSIDVPGPDGGSASVSGSSD